jgi:hypothetical protein
MRLSVGKYRTSMELHANILEYYCGFDAQMIYIFGDGNISRIKVNYLLQSLK